MTAKILIVEDDDFKLERVAKAVLVGQPKAQLVVAESVQKAISQLEEGYALVVLDMALPSHTAKKGESPPTSLPSGGVEVLLELAYSGRPDPVVVITQYPEIEIDEELHPTDQSLVAFHNAQMTNVVDVLKYEPEGGDWVDRLVRIVSVL